MNVLVILAVVAALIGLRFVKPGMLVWLAAWWVGCYVALRYGFSTPVPVSVIKLYMGIVTLSLTAYALADSERWAQVRDPLTAFMTERRYQAWLVVVALLIPALFAVRIYAQMTSDPQAPSFARTVHPAPPDSITVHDTEYPLGTQDNPYRHLENDDPEAFAGRVVNGRQIYYENCFYCHGDLMAGDGMFIHGLNPIPTSFQDPGTIPMLREAFLFWRIAKGAPGLPEEGGPWQSAMPAWEQFLTEEEMWNVILFLYEFTDSKPRAVEELH
ncbi:MAG: cytochrome c [Acidobacteriota bacterium]|nr:cytochrome c [Acidobacteriota bacterium]